MAYQVLARKYRPIRFSDVVGQDHVTRTLLNALSQNRIAHGYIFSGHRGIGKTTIARIVASALNCRTQVGAPERPTPEPCNACESCLEIRQSSSVDVIEIDAATNRGIDEVRELRDAARYRPARDKFKIIILDEAHQITDAAFNALLKTLEEPPDHIVFMFATTEPENIPQTIRSRCQHFSFHAVKLEDIVGQLRKISTDEGILVDDATLSLLAEAGDGSMRDALSIMDQAIASAPVEDGKPHLALEQIRELMGSVSNVIYEQVLEAVHRNNSADVLAIIARLLDAGNGPTQIARQFVRYLRNCVVAKITSLHPDEPAHGIAADLLQISPEERSRAARTATLFTEEELSRFLAVVLRTFDELGYRQEQRFHLELGLLKLVHLQRLIPIEELLSQLGTDIPKPPTTTPSSPVTPPPAGRPTPPRPATPAAAAPPIATPKADPFATTTPPAPPQQPAQPAASPFDFTSRTPSASTAAPTAPAPALAPKSDPFATAAPPRPQPSARPTSSPFADFSARPATQPGGAGPTSPTPTGAPGPDSRTRVPSAAPTSSPFDIDLNRKTPQPTATQSTSAAPTTSGSLAIAPEPAPAARPHLVPPVTPPATTNAPQATDPFTGTATPSSPRHDFFPASAPSPTTLTAQDSPLTPEIPTPAPAAAEPAPAPEEPAETAAEAPSDELTALQTALVEALANGNQETASHQIEDATLTLAGDTVQIQTSVSKAMLPAIFNAETNRILTTTLRQQKPGLKFTLLPGTPANAASAKKSWRPARAGSVQELAEKHPVVQEAKRLFSAEISNIIDLREK